MSDETRAADHTELDHPELDHTAQGGAEQVPAEETDESFQNLFTLGIMAAIAIAFLAICLPLFIL